MISYCSLSQLNNNEMQLGVLSFDFIHNILSNRMLVVISNCVPSTSSWYAFNLLLKFIGAFIPYRFNLLIRCHLLMNQNRCTIHTIMFTIIVGLFWIKSPYHTHTKHATKFTILTNFCLENAKESTLIPIAK